MLCVIEGNLQGHETCLILLSNCSPLSKNKYYIFIKCMYIIKVVKKKSISTKCVIDKTKIISHLFLSALLTSCFNDKVKYPAIEVLR